MRAVIRGLERGKKDFGVHYGLILCAMRSMPPELSQEMAELAVDFRPHGVVGFDLAGEEGGYPPKKHIDAFHYIQRENFNITIHAGEGFGKESIWQAIQWCGAHRIGHATRLLEDMKIKDGTRPQYGNDLRSTFSINAFHWRSASPATFIPARFEASRNIRFGFSTSIDSASP